MQVKWEQISISTFVLYLCEVLGFEAPVWERGLRACWFRFPESDTGPTLTTNHLHLHRFCWFAPFKMAVLKEEKSIPRSSPRKGKSTSEACASEVLHDDWLNL